MRVSFIAYTALAVCVISCKNNSADNTKVVETTDSIAPDNEKANATVVTEQINWDDVPELNNIGDYPFLTSPEGIDVQDWGDKKDGISEIFDLRKWEVYNGTGITTVEGKLAVLRYVEDTSNGLKYDQYIFDRSFSDYLEKSGAKKIYSGKFPEDEAVREKLKENMYSGKYATYGLSDDEPFTVYVLKNKGKKYIITLQSNSAAGHIYIVELKDFNQTITPYKAKDIEKDLKDKGKAVLYINFDTDKATLKPDGKQIVDIINEVLKSDSALKLSINGYTDNTGSTEHNQKLSLSRAETIKNALVSMGISSARLQTKGYGADMPLAANDSEENKAKNRRVELIKL